MLRWFWAALLVLALTALPLGAPAARAEGCVFRLGFAALHDLLPETIGTCLEDEGHNPANGDGLQHTAKGLLVWRKLDNWTAFTDGYRTWVNGPHGLEQRLNSERFPWEANPEGWPVVADAGGPASVPEYLDDRSDATAVLWSFYNAINRHEYARAYAYWEAGAAPGSVPPFPQFAQGYAGTAAVRLVMGTIRGDAGAGQLYYAVPVALIATTTAGATQAFSGCYRLHLGRPAIQAVPPFAPLAIRDASQAAAPSEQDALDGLDGACGGDTAGRPLPVPVSPATPDEVGAERYLDNRSTAAEVVRSYYNAINRHEYARAYGYWEAGAYGTLVPPFAQFQQGYADTAGVRLTTGPTFSNPGAGQIYDTVPFALVAQGTDGATRRFVGCYTVHQPRPILQVAPPFQPMGISSARVLPVPNDANTDALLGQECH